MAEILSVMVKPAMEEFGRITLMKIKPLFTYLCFFKSNIQSLMDEAEKLEDARIGLQREVVAAENDVQVILPEVKIWLEKATHMIQVDKKGIEDEIPAVINGWGVKSRFLLSRRAVKLTTEMKQLMEECNKFSHGTVKSRKQIEEEIMEALRGNEVTTMGICGLGGVGKTTMAKRIMNKVKKECIFEEILMTVVGQQVDLLKIQGEIAESLGLKLREETLLARATKLRARLREPKRILIVLDDVWENLKLEDLGIPYGKVQCTILFISRNKDVLRRHIDAQKIWEVEILSVVEAWLLFREKAGPCVDDPNLLSTAENVARECKGLPIALLTVGAALKDQTSIHYWEDALQQLRSFKPEGIPDVIKDVYNPLKLSYTKLESQHAKSLFLLCSLFPKNVDISLEELTFYCMGLRMFCNLDNFYNTSKGTLEQVRKRVFTMVDELKNHFLLLSGEDEHHVRMHDVVRDVAIYIAFHEAKEGIVDVKFNSMRNSSSEYTYEWVSVFLEKTSNLLRMHASGNRCEIKDFSFFEEIKELNVLSFNFISLSLRSLKIEVLHNLRTLYLDSCTLLETISVVGELSSLEILICRSCDKISELPAEIGSLENLRMLEVYKCRKLERIAPGVISNLVLLEELMIVESFNKWETEENEGKTGGNAAISEVEHLKNLRRLEIEIENSTLAAEMMFLDERKVKYQGRFGGSRWESCEPDDTPGLARWMKDIITSMSPFKYGICNYQRHHQVPPDDHFFRGLEAIEIYDSTTEALFNSLTAANLGSLKELRISKCMNMVKVIDNEEQCLLFPSLHSLYLEDLPKLESLGWRRQPDSLENVWIKGCHRLEFFPRQNVQLHSLRKLVICDCTNIRCLFSPDMAANIDKLTTLSISRCKQMVQVIEINYPDPPILRNLKELEFHDLPNLESFSASWYYLKLPSLENIRFQNLKMSFFLIINPY